MPTLDEPVGTDGYLPGPTLWLSLWPWGDELGRPSVEERLVQQAMLQARAEVLAARLHRAQETIRALEAPHQAPAEGSESRLCMSWEVPARAGLLNTSEDTAPCVATRIYQLIHRRP